MKKSIIAATLAGFVALSACTAAVEQPSTAPKTTAPQAPPTTVAATPTPTPTVEPPRASNEGVPGHAPGHFPPIPAIVVPDISIMNATTKKASETFADKLRSIPGLKVSPAHCGRDGKPLVGGSVVLGGDGAGVLSGGGSSQVNTGEGAGVYNDGETSFVNLGNGAGVLSRGNLSITVTSEGSGTYSDGTVSITLDGRGRGTMSNGQESLTIHGDGEGTYSNGQVSMTNHGDGSGTYTDGTVSIINNGDGTALVGSSTIKADPLPPVPPAGKFPAIDKMAPVEPVCGVYITMSSEVLFDYDKYDIRLDAKATLDKVAPLLNSMLAGTRLQVAGHTDAHGTDAYNQQLSENRAKAVVDALRQAGVTLPLVAVGYGETRPVAPNEINGKDNPGGRQLNRRVDIFVPVK